MGTPEVGETMNPKLLTVIATKADRLVLIRS
jgi:hypothetical protein